MTRARLGLLLLVLLLAGGLIYGFLPRPLAVDVVEVGRAPLAVTVEEEGRTRVMERYVIAAPVSGYARRIALKVGDPVAAGQVLAVLEPVRADALDPRSRAQAQAQVNAAEAALAAARENARVAEAEARLASQDLARIERLGQENFIAQAAVDQARTRWSSSQAARQAAEHQVNVARYQLDTARALLTRAATLPSGGAGETLAVRSPVTARVLKVVHESEGTVAAGQPLLEIGNPEALEVEVEVLSTSAVRIAPKSRVILDRWGGEGALQGTVRRVEPAGFTKISALGVEEQRVRVIVDFTSPRELWQRLGDGYRVEAIFVVWEGADVLQIPTSALFRHDNGWAVFVLEDGRARLRPVSIGQRTGLRAQVLDGLKPGERVISHPDDKVKDGARVRPRA
ncbi:MAG: efflux RND transporter periplasmic adaptor subunit [Pseudomonadota bacterium]